MAPGPPICHIVGLPDTALSEARERVRGAIRNSGFEYPLSRITVDLAPADQRKRGATYDLAIAVGFLVASGRIRASGAAWALLGESSLRERRGATPVYTRAVHAPESFAAHGTRERPVPVASDAPPTTLPLHRPEPRRSALSVASAVEQAPSGWDDRVLQAPGGHVMQGTAWADHRRALGASPWFLTFDDGGAALVTLRRSTLLPGVTAVARRGPPHAGAGPEELAARCVALGEWARSRGARDLFLDPELEHHPRYGEAMARAGFVIAPEFQPSIHVMRLSLPPGSTEGSIFEGFSKSTRQRIRAAERAGTTVREDPGGESLDEFGRLLVERGGALGIVIRPEQGYVAAWRRLIAAGQAQLLIAENGGRPLGALLLYLQGGIRATAYSADHAALRDQFPGTMHLVRWRAIRDAVAEAMPAIELGGVDLPGRRSIPDPGDPNHGLYMHKAGFGARWVVRTPARRIVLRPWADRAARGARRLVGRASRLRCKA